jgi:signal transduction histidine kinase/Na+/proline symporter
MSFHWSFLVLGAVIYLLVLFFTAYFAEKGKFSEKLIKHPIVYVLAFGVSCSSWAFYGSIGMAYELQHGYLAFYIGISILLLFSAIVIRPLFNLAKTYHLSSLADLFAFRYRSRWVGLVTATGVFLAVLPLLALQIQAITDVIVILDPKAHTWFIAGIVAIILLYITVLFGTRDIKPSEKHPGLIFALAIESLFKLVVFVIIGLVAYFKIGGGVSEMQEWIRTAPSNFSTINPELRPAQWFSLVLLFVSAPLVLPHLFQILFRENSQPNRLRFITWATPIYLFIMALPVFPIMWAGIQSGSPLSPEYFTLSVGLSVESPLLVWLTFLGGLSAASGVTIIAVLSLSSMMLNHAVLPFYSPSLDLDIYRWLIWVRRILIGAVFALIFSFYLFLNQVQNQSTLLITSYTGLLQLTPGLLGLLFWSGANRKGFISGAIVGLSFWFIMQLWPVIVDSLSLSDRLPLHFAIDRNNWYDVIYGSIALNAITFFIVSLVTKTSPEEKNAAKICVISSVARRERIPLKAKNAREFIDSLSKPLGQVMAEREVRRAIKQLKIDLGEYRPYALRRLRDTLEANLSGIMGPSVAQAMVSRYLPHEQAESVGHEDIHFLEQNLDNYHYQLSGMSAELDRLRRHHRETLYRLPIGVCSLTIDGEILLWNELMAELTGIDEDEAIGANIDLLPGQWYDLLDSFVKGDEEKITIEQDDPKDPIGKRWFSLHRTKFGQASSDLNEGIIVLLEDETEHKMLESELVHSERLASIGRLAAGVAHEIGNPITGIDCLAQDLKYAEGSEEIAVIGDQIRHQADRVTKIVRSLINFSHAGQAKGKSEHQPHSLTKIVQEAIDLLSLSRDEKEIRFINEVSSTLDVICEPQRLSQVFINLLGNARDASPANETVVIAAEPEYARETISVTVTDKGSGISADDLDHIFDPFFTTKEVGKGTGLGLFLSYTIVEEHYGHISAQSPAFILEDIGTRFTIRLPLHVDVTSGNT